MGNDLLALHILRGQFVRGCKMMQKQNIKTFPTSSLYELVKVLTIFSCDQCARHVVMDAFLTRKTKRFERVETLKK